MADSTANRTDAKENIIQDAQSYIVKSAETMAKKRYTAIDQATGFVENADASAGLLNWGWASENSRGSAVVLGDGTSAVKWTVRGGLLDEDVSIAGLASAADIHKAVYATDNQTLTLTKPTIGTPIGFVADFKSGTTGTLFLFSREGAVNLGLAGGTREILHIANVSSIALEGTSAVDLMTIPMQSRGKIISLHGVLVHDDTGTVAGAQTLNLEIDGVNVTGGILTLGFADAQGAQLDATGITALNTYNQDSALQLELVASGTGFTAAQDSYYRVYAVIEHLPGA